jgi:uncharacterized membrane protein YecN with MAPEG domain
MSWPILSLHAAALWSGLLILWLLGLSVLVVMRRRRHRVLFGDGGEGEMTTATRAFGNAAEYIPPGIGALILLALLGIPAPWVHGIGATLLVGRVIHGWGLLYLKGPSVGRILGMALTWLPLALAAAMLIVHSLI